jgi:trigger factor
MQVKVTNKTTTEAEVAIIATEAELIDIKKHVLGHFKNEVKLPGFRAGNVPLELVEKNVDPNQFQTRFLDEAIDQLYKQAMQDKKLRIAGQPKVTLKKFVPFTALEFDVILPVIGKVKLADYKTIKVKKTEAKVLAKDVTDILENISTRMAEKKDVERAAKDGDQIWIDFAGVDTEGKAVKGADGKNYPLNLGSKTFIPGFEENLVGQKANDEKEFTLTFPKDYGVKTLAGSKVTFTVTVTKVQEVVKPKIDDEFAKSAGPFKDLASLKSDVKKQLLIEKEGKAEKDYESELIREVSKKSTVEMPDVLVEEQLDQMLAGERQNAIYRGATWEEYLEQQGTTEDKFKEQIKPAAKDRVKASIVLSEIAEKEDIQLTKEELDARLAELKAEHKDPQMLAELDKPEGQNNVASRILTEKTIKKILSYQK